MGRRIGGAATAGGALVAAGLLAAVTLARPSPDAPSRDGAIATAARAAPALPQRARLVRLGEPETGRQPATARPHPKPAPSAIARLQGGSSGAFAEAGWIPAQAGIQPRLHAPHVAGARSASGAGEGAAEALPVSEAMIVLVLGAALWLAAERQRRHA